MMDRIVPDYVVVVEHSESEFAGGLRVEEEVALGRVVEKRYWEFAIGRYCAHRGLARLGAPDMALLPGPSREPIWPGGYVGSITHCEGYCAAAVARVEQVISMGIDAESVARIPDNMLDLIAFDHERRWIEAGQDAARDKLTFSAKESVFKAWFPLTGTWLGFEDVRIFFDVESETFVAHLLVAGPAVHGTRVQAFRGRYACTDRLLLTAVVLIANEC
jgi:4'-phosphopantetheinyl transferase EntD